MLTRFNSKKRSLSAFKESISATKPRTILCTVAVIIYSVTGYLRLKAPTSVFVSHNNYLPNTNSYLSWSFAHTNYSDILALYISHHLYSHMFPYLHFAIEYPVLLGLFMYTSALFGGIQTYFVISTVALSLCCLATYLILEKITPKYAWIFAVNPLLYSYEFLNWDLLAIFFMIVAYYFYIRKYYILSGIFFALGTFTKFFPVILFIFICLGLFFKKDRNSLFKNLGSFGIATLIINLPFMILNISNWWYFYYYNIFRKGKYSILYVFFPRSKFPVITDTFAILVTLVALIVGIYLLKRKYPVIQTASMVFVIFLTANKVFSPQYMLWIFIFVLLASWPKWTFILIGTAGIVDYYNSWTLLHFETPDYPHQMLTTTQLSTLNWYSTTIYPLGLDLRYITLMILIIAGVSLIAKSTLNNDRAGNRISDKTQNL